MPRAKPTKPTRKMRQAALAALHDIVTDDATPSYARAKAAQSLLAAVKGDVDPDAQLRDPDEPRKYVVLPDNGRNASVRYGLYSDDQRVVIVPPGYPFEVHPESHYAGVAKPAPDPRFSRNRPEPLALPGSIEDEAA